jgi:hypothetical protein
MRVIIEGVDGGKQAQVFEDVSDVWVAVRQRMPAGAADGTIVYALETRSYSFGPNIRELVKEGRQALVELEDLLMDTVRRQRAGSPRGEG